MRHWNGWRHTATTKSPTNSQKEIAKCVLRSLFYDDITKRRGCQTFSSGAVEKMGMDDPKTCALTGLYKKVSVFIYSVSIFILFVRDFDIIEVKNLL